MDNVQIRVDEAYMWGYTIFFLVWYFAPTILAFCRKTVNRWQALIVNFFLGWTFIGWVIALVMAASKNKEV